MRNDLVPGQAGTPRPGDDFLNGDLPSTLGTHEAAHSARGDQCRDTIRRRGSVAEIPSETGPALDLGRTDQFHRFDHARPARTKPGVFAEFRTTHRGTNLVLTLGLDDFPEFGNLFQVDYPRRLNSPHAHLGEQVGPPR